MSLLSRFKSCMGDVLNPKLLGKTIGIHKFIRNISRSGNTDIVQEVKMKVPWGHIAGRLWNGSDPTRKPVLCIHGWKDNAATWVLATMIHFYTQVVRGEAEIIKLFPGVNCVAAMFSDQIDSPKLLLFDTLMPLLIPKVPHLQFLAIDLPGHGLSSHFPVGMLYHTADCLILISRIMSHYKWKTISILGHSYGGMLGFLFAGLHNNLVEKYIAIDGMTPLVFSTEDTLVIIKTISSELLNFEEKLLHSKMSQVKYSYDDIVKKIRECHVGNLTEAGAKTLLTRGCCCTAHGSNLYTFTHDIRVQHMPILYYSDNELGDLAQNIKAGVLRVMASGGMKYMSPYMLQHLPIWLRKNNDNGVYFEEIPSDSHHVHLLTPESVEPFITKMLLEKYVG